MSDCIFCQIAKGTAPAHIIWQDDRHLAFLSIFPNTPAFTVVITKQHYGSYFADLTSQVRAGLLDASSTVARLLDEKLPDVGRTALIFEGFGVDHIHAKLFPMHGTGDLVGWKQLKSNVDKFFDHYEGYVSSHDYKRADDKTLACLATKIKS